MRLDQRRLYEIAFSYVIPATGRLCSESWRIKAYNPDEAIGRTREMARHNPSLRISRCVEVSQ